MLINIISRDNSAGLSVDKIILKNILTREGWDVHFSDYKSLKRFSLWSRNYYDLNIFLQWANPTWLKFAKKNILIPNPEWFKEKWEPVISKFDAIFCKTKIAAKIFQSRNDNTIFTSFTSLDRSLPTIQKEDDQWIHVAGKSKLKGTETIIKTWLSNPYFPHLTIIQRNSNSIDKFAENLTIISEFLELDQLQEMMNRCSVHLCPSETEGFGHYIGEALSCGAIVITTDAPPMNELVSDERGFVVKPVSEKKMKLATAYDINQMELEHTVSKVICPGGRAELSKNARAYFMANDRFFRHEIVKQIKIVVRGIDY